MDRTPQVFAPPSVHDARPSPYDHPALAEKFRPIFQRIADTVLERERTRTLPFEPITWLKQAGFGAVRVPVEHGGGGASIPQLFQLLIELSEADSNVTQALRGHFAFVEDRLNAPASAQRDLWLQRFVAGELVGNAWSEVGSVAIGDVITKVSQKDGEWVANGRKFYSTGSIFADWIDLYARRADNNADIIAAVSTHQPGVVQQDDWDGFGQRTTGSGTSVYTDAKIAEENIFPFETRFKYQTAYYQLFHLATLAGIGRAIERDVAQQVRDRQRVYSNGNASHVSQDAQIQQVVGQISALVYAAEATALRATLPAQRAFEARLQGDNAEAERQANIDAEIESAQGQIVVSELVLRAGTDLFNALGASAASTSKSLDRHWRNARTVASHNPIVYKSRIVGDWRINGTEPPYVWQIGNGTGRKV
ncbi:alkylation response protein AidB-like acyl-CoA dehydrogenase [Rhodoferax ferrireducens]|uniref:Alkylation response protein AidB-like acyl-CoA dehydrogenase n=1 Tax=Rhodoferax ferrireducens TaxID=192843 RepID=A0ABU2CDF8_9BURK|nr:acyl-CoA dehydrogenase family protein [Rhodoferax ferrireducens]MDR7379365.1 alkylation response protein AidB-like acyl-CoA dehydrogenase [Rhodoferax ferrireducens]